MRLPNLTQPIPEEIRLQIAAANYRFTAYSVILGGAVLGGAAVIAGPTFIPVLPELPVLLPGLAY